MDHTEDLSARVVFKQILSIEEPRTPLTHSVSQTQSTVGPRRSSRLNKTDGGAQTPRDILKRNLKHKIRESISRKSLPVSKRSGSVVLRKINTPDPTSLICVDDDTPRHLLKNILREESVKSPLVHKEPATKELQLPSANSSVSSRCPSVELSELDLPDITIGNAANTAKRLSRKRPRHSLNVTAFEKQLKDRDDVGKEGEESEHDHSLSSTFSSSASLSLKTPFVDVWTEKRGLQRKVPNRRKVTVEEFGAAVQKRHMSIESGVSSVEVMEQAHVETAQSEGFTLGISRFIEPDVTTDIVSCNTALYSQPDAMTSNSAVVAAQDKPAAIASPLQREITGVKEGEQMEVVPYQNLVLEESTYCFPTEEGIGLSCQTKEDCASFESQSEKYTDAAESQNEEEKNKTNSQSEEDAAAGEEEHAVESQTEVDAVAMSQFEEEQGEAKSLPDECGEEDDATESQIEDEDAAYSKTEEDAAVTSQSEEEEVPAESQTEEVPSDSQSEEEVASRSVFEGEEGTAESQPEAQVAAESQDEEEETTESEEEAAGETQNEEEDADDSQSEDVAADRSQSEDEEVAAESQTEEGDALESQNNQEDPAANYQSEQEGAATDSQTEEEHDGKQEEGDIEQASEQLAWDLEHISRRAQRSEGGLILPVGEDGGGWTGNRRTEAAGSVVKSKAASTGDLHSSLDVEKSEHLHFEVPDLAQSLIQGPAQNGSAEVNPDADKENSLHLLNGTYDFENSGCLSTASPEQAAAAQDPSDEEEEWEDEEDGEHSEELKTPAFVREKRNFFHPDPLASATGPNTQTSVASEGLPAAKPKPARQKKTQPAKRESSLPKSYLMGVFKHFAKTKVSADVYPILDEIMDKFFARLAEDLETYAVHGKRKTIEVEDVELLLKRQGYVNDKVPVEVLIEKHLRMEQRKLLIPIATSGNIVIPKLRRR
ncbi:hypothetical protein LDENG_00158740 [Lucifuga dentata]|nr:hypothetical protein LDENG_00158740 [Lucifuga dentata]